MKLNINAGHGKRGSNSCGAIGLICESTENRNVKNELISLLKVKHTVFDCTIDDGASASDIINKIVKKCNTNTVDLNVSIHFNSGAKDKVGNGKTTGIEVLVYSLGGEAEKIAKRICEKVSKLTGLKNRGVKVRPDLGFLRSTRGNSILIECAFVDDFDDVKAYNYKVMAKAIAEGITNETFSNPSAPTGSNTYFRVCLDSFKVKSNAEKLLKEAKAKDFKDAFIATFTKDGDLYYRVCLASFKDKSNANKLLDEAKAKGYNKTFITTFTN